MGMFSLIHRDFRGCNMHLVSRDDLQGNCVLKVLDLGVMICAEDGQDFNHNLAVQAFRRRGDTEEKKRRYDWLPWEVREGADGIGPAVNFAPPPHSFDVFSVGVLILHLLIGKTEARVTLDKINDGANMPNTRLLNLDPEIVRRMLGEASKRPHPKEILASLCQNSLPQEIVEDPRTKARSRSRSRVRKQRERRQRWQAAAGRNGDTSSKQLETTDTVARVASDLAPANGVLDNEESVLHQPQQKGAWPTPVVAQMPQEPQSPFLGCLSTCTAQSYPTLQSSHVPQQPRGGLPPSGPQPRTPPVRVSNLQALHAAQTCWYPVHNNPPPVSTMPICPRSAPALFPLQSHDLRGDPTSLLSHALWMVAGLNAPGSANGSNITAVPQPQAVEQRQPQPTNVCSGMTSWLSL